MRTHRLLLVLNFAVSFRDNDKLEYLEYHDLKKLLTRKEMMSLYNALKRGDRHCTFSNPVINQVVGV